jgi:hypothetical protein
MEKRIDASDRTRNIEEGVHLAEIEVIENPQESLNLATKISNFAKEELSVLFSSPNSFHRHSNNCKRRKWRILLHFWQEIACPSI